MSLDTEAFEHGVRTKRWLTVNQLWNILSNMDPTMVVLPNSVGNLVVLSKDGSEDVGFIDFRRGEFELF